ncbi:MAG TPA: HAMP domain-containing histidine kinase [Desulfuromonadales bacterium]|nr:HAMP domain-containing histidine kinase [Desulfuromonadales bacterium]
MSKYRETQNLHDIMDSRVMEVRQKQLEHERIMIHQARRAAMGEALGVIAHKWRQPLNAISLSVQNIKDAWECGEINEELLERATLNVMERIKLLSHMIDDYRSYIKPSVSTEHFNPIQCVKVLVPLLTNVLSCFAAIEIQDVDALREDIQVAGSQDTFRQVLHNLLSNAADAVQKQKVRFGTTLCGAITIAFRRVESDIIITVADNGGGIAESLQEKIFDPLFTTKDDKGGFGIGLYLSKIIIENSMDGSLWFDNIPGGARFSIRLPCLAVKKGPL